jgi:hypothetical protein
MLLENYDPFEKDSYITFFQLFSRAEKQALCSVLKVIPS